MKNNTNEGQIIVIVAPSGTGKSTLIKRLFNECGNLDWSVSYTTRPARSNEINGKDYYFVSQDEFFKLRDQGEFIEFAEVHGNWYGTAKKVIEENLFKGKNLLFDLDVQGSDAFKKVFKDRAKIIFIAPPSLEVLEKRLRGRGTEKESDLYVRLSNAARELKRKDDYDYCIVNDGIDQAYVSLFELVKKILNASIKDN